MSFKKYIWQNGQNLLWIVAGFFILLASWAKYNLELPRIDFIEQYNEILNQRIVEEDLKVDQLVIAAEESLSVNYDFESFALNTNLLQSNRIIQVFKDKTLIFWNSNKLPMFDLKFATGDSLKLWTVDNVDYLVFARSRNGRNYYFISGLQSAKNQFSLFPVGINTIKISGNSKIEHQQLAPNSITSIAISDGVYMVQNEDNARMLAVSMILVVLLLMLLAMLNFGEKITDIFWFAFLLLALRLVLSFGRNLFHLSSLKLFDSSVFGVSSVTPSLGDMMLHLAAFFIFLSYCYKRKKYLMSYFPLFSKSIFQGVIQLSLLTNFYTIFIINVLFKLIDNSNSLTFSVIQFYKFNIYSLLAFATVIFLVFTVVLILNFAFKWIADQKQVKFFLIVQVIAFVIIYIVMGIVESKYELFTLIPLILTLVFSVVYWFSYDTIHTNLGFVLLVLVCLAFGWVFSYQQGEKQLNTAYNVAQSIYSPNDPYAEFIFSELDKKLASDKQFLALISAKSFNKDEISGRIKSKYLNGYLSRYTVKSVKKNVASTNQLNDAISNNIEDFDEKNRINVTSFVQDAKLNYQVSIPLWAWNNRDTLVLEFEQKGFYKQSNVDFRTKVLDDFPEFNYSTAIYIDNKLIDHQGDFPYPLVDIDFIKTNDNQQFEFQTLDRKNHLLYRPNNNSLVVVSMAKLSLFDIVSTGSGIFLFGFIIYLVFMLIFNLLRRKKSFETYQSIIESSLIGLVIFVLFVIGYTTVYFTIYNTRLDLQKRLEDKIKNIALFTEDEIKKRGKIIRIDNEMSAELNLLANNSNSEIEVYGLDGRMIFKTNSLTDRRSYQNILIDPQAFDEIDFNKRSIYIREEGNLINTGMTAFMPVRNAKNNINAIISTPYYYSGQGLWDASGSFLGTLINIYVLILIAAITLAFTLSKRITKPLAQMTKIITNTKLGLKSSVNIPENNKDEISIMIKEYNSMLKQLELNAELLAQSEKDAAWRMMARQVAHEIRNPLTPIKLSVQLLLRAWKEQSQGFDTMLNKVGKTILEQIDSLTLISQEFSAFAQMPLSQQEEVDIFDLAEMATHLFEDSAKVYFKNETGLLTGTIRVDKEQVSRVFNNLIKNATQSRNDTENIEVYVIVTYRDPYFTVEIKDNGMGINADIREKIFEPNFTTKNSGMGLGLAIVKRIIEQNNGKIWFETLEKVGTSFYFSFSKAE